MVICIFSSHYISFNRKHQRKTNGTLISMTNTMHMRWEEWDDYGDDFKAFQLCWCIGVDIYHPFLHICICFCILRIYLNKFLNFSDERFSSVMIVECALGECVRHMCYGFNGLFCKILFEAHASEKLCKSRAEVFNVKSDLKDFRYIYSCNETTQW